MKPPSQLVRIRVDAPSGDTALALERRLAHLTPTTVAVGGRWQVELDDDGDRIDQVLAAVRHWLDLTDIEETVVHVDGRSRRLTRPTRTG